MLLHRRLHPVMDSVLKLEFGWFVPDVIGYTYILLMVQMSSLAAHIGLYLIWVTLFDWLKLREVHFWKSSLIRSNPLISDLHTANMNWCMRIYFSKLSANLSILFFLSSYFIICRLCCIICLLFSLVFLTFHCCIFHFVWLPIKLLLFRSFKLMSNNHYWLRLIVR